MRTRHIAALSVEGLGAMGRRAFIIVADWPYRQLSDAGKITWCCTGCTESHLGIFIPCCTSQETEAHSDPRISHPSGREKKHVAFDYMMDKYPKFQSPENPRYYTEEANVWLYPILDADAAEVHALCMRVARARPYNNFMYRFNAVFWCWPLSCWWSNTDALGPSHCVALTMRIIASARTKSDAPLTSDIATFTALKMDRWGCANLCAPQKLTGHSPRSALEALQKGGNVGSPVQGFGEAVRLCRGGGATVALGSVLPLLPVALMSRV